MILYLSSIATLLALSNAEPTRNLGKFGGDVQNKIEKMCPELSSECPTIVEGDCTFEKPAERPNFFEMTKEEIEYLKAQRKERKEQMLLCICCDKLDLEEILAKRPSYGSGGKGYGKGDGKGYYKAGDKGYDKGGDGKGYGKEYGKGYDWGYGKGNDKGYGKGGDKRYSKEGDGNGNGKGYGWGYNKGDDTGYDKGGDGKGYDKGYDWGYDKGYGYGKGYDKGYGTGYGKGYGKGTGKTLADIQAKLDQKCPEFDCDWVDPLTVDCTRFDAKMSGEWGKNRLLRGKGDGKNFLYCGCCRNDEDSDYYYF